MHVCTYVCAAVAAYVSFVHNITAVYNSPQLPIFLTIANHEAGQSAAMKIALADPGVYVCLCWGTTAPGLCMHVCMYVCMCMYVCR
jgi:hypothetical protein